MDGCELSPFGGWRLGPCIQDLCGLQIIVYEHKPRKCCSCLILIHGICAGADSTMCCSLFVHKDLEYGPQGNSATQVSSITMFLHGFPVISLGLSTQLLLRERKTKRAVLRRTRDNFRGTDKQPAFLLPAMLCIRLIPKHNNAEEFQNDLCLRTSEGLVKKISLVKWRKRPSENGVKIINQRLHLFFVAGKAMAALPGWKTFDKI